MKAQTSNLFEQEEMLTIVRPDSDQTSALQAFRRAIDQAFALPEAQRIAIQGDFARGLELLSSKGMPFSDSLQRLHPGRLDGFYEKPRQGFYPLDNGAKQYPIAMTGGRMVMFRLSATLDTQVNPVLLQLALVFTLKRFPHYATALKKGVFWYYLKPVLARYAVQPDTGAICKPIDLSGEAQPLFRVFYRDASVSVELFHALTDGIGGMMFLKSLLTEYYRLQGEDTDDQDPQVLDTAAPPSAEDMDNAFARFHTREKDGSLLAAPAIQLPGEQYPAGECRVERYAIAAQQLRDAAHAYGVSVTAFMSAVILAAARDTSRAEAGRYQLQVTMDLRRVFHSPTLRNFSWYGALCLGAQETLTGKELAEVMQRQLKAMSRRETLEVQLSSVQRTIRILRFVPLQWKAMVLRTVYRVTGDFFFTTTLSNLGVIALHGPLRAHVREMAAILGPSPGNPYSFGLATAGEQAVLSVTRTTDDLTMRSRLMESALAYGLPLTLKG